VPRFLAEGVEGWRCCQLSWEAVGGDSFGQGEIRRLGCDESELPVRHLSQDVEWVFRYVRPKSRKEV
jgi:hypothetical protein